MSIFANEYLSAEGAGTAGDQTSVVTKLYFLVNQIFKFFGKSAQTPYPPQWLSIGNVEAYKY